MDAAEKVERDITFGVAVEHFVAQAMVSSAAVGDVMCGAPITLGHLGELRKENEFTSAPSRAWLAEKFDWASGDALIVLTEVGRFVRLGMTVAMDTTAGRLERLYTADNPLPYELREPWDKLTAEWRQAACKYWLKKEWATSVEGAPDTRFDFRLPPGRIDDEYVHQWLFEYAQRPGEELRVEVKGDVYSSWSGNLAVEIMYRGRNSGILKTEADWWAHVPMGPCYCSPSTALPELILLFHAHDLKRFVEVLMRQGCSPTPAGDSKWARVVLTTIGDVAKGLKGV